MPKKEPVAFLEERTIRQLQFLRAVQDKRPFFEDRGDAAVQA
jgi:hypothetical protein